MLYPKMNRARTVMDLSGLWEFKLGDYETPGDTCERLAGGERLIRITMDGPGMKERSRFLLFLRGRGCFCVLMP